MAKKCSGRRTRGLSTRIPTPHFVATTATSATRRQPGSVRRVASMIRARSSRALMVLRPSGAIGAPPGSRFHGKRLPLDLSARTQCALQGRSVTQGCPPAASCGRFPCPSVTSSSPRPTARDFQPRQHAQVLRRLRSCKTARIRPPRSHRDLPVDSLACSSAQRIAWAFRRGDPD